jgi:hypothetical protein
VSAKPAPSVIVITHAKKASAKVVLAAKQCAQELQLPFVRRSELPLAPLSETTWLVHDSRGVFLHSASGTLRYSPGIGVVRVKRLQQGDVSQADRLLQCAQLRPDDRVLDLSFGLGGDSLVCAHVIGSMGQVLACEGSLPLFVLAKSGMRYVPMFQNGAPIVLQHITAQAMLDSLPDCSVDVVIADFMFEKRADANQAFLGLRHYAISDTVWTSTLLQDCLRVCRRRLVIKAHVKDKHLRELGLQPAQFKPGKPVAFYVVAA